MKNDKWWKLLRSIEIKFNLKSIEFFHLTLVRLADYSFSTPGFRKRLANMRHLLPGMCGAHAAAQKRVTIRCGRRQHQVDVHPTLQQAAPEIKCVFFIFVPSRDYRAYLRAQIEIQVLQVLIQQVGIFPQLPAQFRPGTQDS